jgi:hypothetical protein
MVPAPGFGRSAAVEFGMGSVGQFGSVGRGKACSVSSVFSNEIGQLSVLRIRVSMVRFRPGGYS